MKHIVKKFRVDALVLAIPLGALVGAILAMVLTASMPKSYTASTVLFIGSPAAGDSAGAYQGDLFSQQRAGTYAQLFSGDDLAVKVNDDLSLGLTPTELSSKITATAIERTVLLQVDVVDSTAAGAADIANAYASNFAQFVGQLENPTGGGQPSSLVTVIRAADPPAVPTSPSSTTNLAAGVFLGALLAGGGVYLRRRFDKRVRTADSLAESVGAPVLGVLPANSDRERSLLTLPEDSTDTYTEAARKMRTTVQFVDSQKRQESLVVTAVGCASAARQVASTLALLLTETGRSVVLVDADLREATLHRYIGSPDVRNGLTEVLSGAVMVEDAIVSAAGGRMSFLGAGTRTDTPGEDLASTLMRTVLAELRRTYDHVIVATSNGDEYADAAVLSHEVDGALIVVSPGGATTAQVVTAARSIRSTGGRIYGAVLASAGRPGSRHNSTKKVTAKKGSVDKKPVDVASAVSGGKEFVVTDAPSDATRKAAPRDSMDAASSARRDGAEYRRSQDRDHDAFADEAYQDQAVRDEDYRDESDRGQGSRDQGFRDQGFRDQGSRDQGYRTGDYRDQDYRNRPNRDQGYRDEGYRDEGYRDQGYQDRPYRDQVYREDATDPFPVVGAEDPFQSAMETGWAPAAPIRRHAPSRSFPRTALPAAKNGAAKNRAASSEEPRNGVSRPSTSTDGAEANEGGSDDAVAVTEQPDDTASDTKAFAASKTERTDGDAASSEEAAATADESSESDESGESPSTPLPAPRRNPSRTGRPSRDSLAQTGRVRGKSR